MIFPHRARFIGWRQSVLLLALCWASQPVFAQSGQATPGQATWNDLSLPAKERAIAIETAIEKLRRTIPDSAMTLARQMLQLTQQEGLPEYEGNALSAMALLHMDKGAYDVALDYQRQALQIYRDQHYQKGLAEAYNNMGLIYDYRGIYPQALDYYQKSLRVREELKDTMRMAIQYNNIGIMYALQKDYANARLYFLKVLDIRKRKGETKRIGRTYTNLGALAMDMGDYEEAREYFEQSLAIKLADGDSFGIAMTYSNLGGLAFEEGAYALAVDYHLRALAIKLRLGHQHETARSYQNLGNAYFRLGQLAKARETCSLSLNLAREIGSVYEEKEACLCLYETYQALGLYREALEWHKAFYFLSDSLFNRENTEELTRLAVRYEFQKQQDSLQAASELRQVQYESDIEKQRLYRNGALLALAPVLMIAFLLYRQGKIRRERNWTIQKSLEEKEVLLKEIHHRVKNNLQVISSLLSIQADYLPDSLALEAITQGKRRVKSMALIHQKLYQNDNLVGIDFQDYVEQLCQALLHSFGYDSSSIQLSVDCGDAQFDVETAVPIGLIINEIISNSLKYAFRDRSPGEIGVRIEDVQPGQHVLTVWDNGPGIPGGLDLERSDSMGLHLIKLLTRQLGGTVTYSGDHGAVYRISFSDRQSRSGQRTEDRGRVRTSRTEN